MIYTTYFAKLKKLPPRIVPIAICGKAPEWYKGRQYKKLAPKIGFFRNWKETGDNDYYIRHFNGEVLSTLNPQTVVTDLYKESEGHDFALVCYEKPGDFCHRHLVADWLNENGYETKEWSELNA